MSRPPAAAGGSRLGLLQVALAGVLWGTGGLAVQIVRGHAPLSVLTISAYRTTIAALVLVAVLVVARGLPGVVVLLRHSPARTVVVGLCTGAYQALYFAAVVLVGVSVATVVSLGLAPVLLTAVESRRARRLPTAGRFAGLLVALVGLVLVSAAGGLGGSGPHPVWGLLAASASGCTYALATGLGRPLAQRAGPLVLTTTTTTVGALGLLPLGLLPALSNRPVWSDDVGALLTLAYLGVLTMALAYGLLYAGLRTTTGSAAVVATLLEPVTAAVLAALVLGERLGPAGLVGTVLILAAVLALGRQPRTALGPAG